MKTFNSFLLFVSLLVGYSDGVAAIVGDNIILKSDISFKVQMYEMQGLISDDDKNVYKKMLDDEINNLIILSLAKQDTNISVPDSEVYSMAEEQLLSMISQAGGKNSLKNIYNTSIEQIEKNIRSQVKDMLFINMYSTSIVSGLDVSSKDVLDFYSSYKDSLPQIPQSYDYSIVHIPYTPSKQDLDKSRDLLYSIKDSIGTNFSLFDKYAKFYSEDPGSKDVGGLLPEVKRGDFVPEYEKTVFNMPIGSISNPVLTDFGYHLIYLINRTGEKFLTKHILIQNNNNVDREYFYKQALEIKNFYADKIIQFDSLAYSFSKDPKNLSGVFEMATKDQITPSVLSVLDKTKSGSFSEIKDLGDGCFVLFKKNISNPRDFNIDKDWGYLKNFTLNKKRENFIMQHINKNKEKVYIKILNE